MKALVTVIALCLALVSSALYAAEKEAVQSNAAKRTDMPVFKPTNVGAPITRLGGATRSTTGSVPRTEALVPEEAGHTLQAQPVMYW